MRRFLAVIVGVAAACHRDSPRQAAIPLSPPVLELRRNIEAVYRRSVRIELAPLDTASATSHVEPDGTPVIQLDVRESHSEADVAHELWHLKQTAAGMPARRWRHSADGPEETSKAFLFEYDGRLLDPILHSRFYPDLRRRGLDPDLLERAATEKLLATKLDPSGVYPFLPLTWVECALNSRDGRLQERLRAWYLSNHAEGALRTGEAIVALLGRSRLETPEEVIAAYVASLNLLLRGRAEFRVAGWLAERRGAITQRIVVIEQVE